MFSIVFTDFHLFDRLYGMEDVPQERVSTLIREMELEDKVAYAEGRFNTLNLSTGQRKRLGLIVALLEDKPVCIFDEWAADQDQHFRKHFYEVILQKLKAAGKTVIAVTHDDRYWKYSDRVIKFDEGRIVQNGSGGGNHENGAG
jgi:putative ATP-binding cassette transporter